MAEKHGIEIDYCPNCRGIWLDRGELDKIIERSAEYNQEDSYSGSYDHQEKQKKDHSYGKRESFLRQLFD
jgi:Zn-finger nucleic acid-binding protein